MSQFNFIIITVVATTLNEGSLTIFNFANNLQSLPLSLFGIPFAIASFPILSSHFQKKSGDKYYDLFYKTFKQILFFVIPATVAFILLRAQIVRLVLGSGRFDWQDTILTMETLAMFTLSLIAQSLLPLLVRAFYAIENTITPFIIACVSTVMNVIFSYTLIHLPVPSIFHEYLQCETLGVLGLALAYSLGSIIQMLLLWIALRRKVLMKKTKSYKVFIFIIKNTIASIFLGFGISIGKNIWGRIFDLTEAWQVLGQAGFAMLLGGMLYYAIMKILKVEEFLYWESRILSKVKTVLYANSKRS
jgi:putative peptidoglycan lipid II flippase